jgi:GST-like protein
MLKLYFHNTPNPFKAALMLEELELEYEVVPVDTRKGEQHAPDFLAVNPNAKVPAIDDDGTVVFDSGAIVLYLAQKHGRFLAQGDVASGEELSWFFWIATGLSPFSGQHVHFSLMAPEDLPYAKNRYAKEIARHYRVLNDRLAGRDWIGGADYGICDIAGWGWARLGGRLFADGLAGYPNVQAWFDRVEARPAVGRVKALVERQTFKSEMDDEAKRAMFPQNY